MIIEGDRILLDTGLRQPVFPGVWPQAAEVHRHPIVAAQINVATGSLGLVAAKAAGYLLSRSLLRQSMACKCQVSVSRSMFLQLCNGDMRSSLLGGLKYGRRAWLLVTYLHVPSEAPYATLLFIFSKDRRCWPSRAERVPTVCSRHR